MKKCVGLFLLLTAAPAVAQVTPAPAPAPAAQLPQLPPEKSIPLNLAVEAAQEALQVCAAKKSAATVEVVDLNGLNKVVLSADGARANSFEYARRKAYTVLRKSMSSGAFGKTLGTIPRETLIEGDPSLIQFAGGLPIMRNGAMIGTISVSGPTGQLDDEICAQAGLDKIRARL